MASPQEKLANALESLKDLQREGIQAFRYSDFSRLDRELLIKQGFLQEVLKGWYIASPHNQQKGDTTAWFTSFWGFCSRYLDDRFGQSYCISAEQSLSLHAGNDTIPHQLIVRSPKGTNSAISLLYGTSIFVMKSPLPTISETQLKNGIRIVDLVHSLVHCTPSTFRQRTTEMQTALLMVTEASELLNVLLNGGHTTIAGQLAGAFRNMKREDIADEIMKTMKLAGFDVREKDPFEEPTPALLVNRTVSPYVNRVQLMWDKMRKTVIESFPPAPGIPKDHKEYLQKIEDLYTTDAYHSLSIERYQVSPELIERVRSGKWNMDTNESDRQQRDAMAARGYFQAFKSVETSIQRILKGENSGKVLHEDHGDWFRELFAPSVAIGIVKPSDLAGYRVSQVYIGQSKHTPMNKDAVRDVMPLLFELLATEPEASVRAVLGHFIFVYTHPYMDGNGRIGRFLMNTMLCSGGYPWTVIPVEMRDEYMNALEAASVDQDIEPFTTFIASLVEQGMNNRPVAKI